MTRHTENMRVQRYEILSFLWMVWKLTLKLASLSIFRPNALGRLSDVFSEIYSRLWDFAEHSISHKDFYLPSSLGVSAVNRVNILLAELYGRKFASLSFGGSSGALLTLLTAVLPKLHPDRGLILFDDVCHQSTIGGLIFGRWEAVRLIRDLQPEHQSICPLKFDTVKATIERHGPDKFAAIILVLPSYDGFRSPSEDKKIYAYAKSHGISVIVDGAWDALRFRESEPENTSLSSICDVWITSPHKHGLTPSSLGCILTDNETIAGLWDEALDLGFRSSSVSFVEIMIAEHRLSQIVNGDWDISFDQASRAADILSSRIQQIHPALHVVEPSDVQAETHNPTHILISTAKIDGFDARHWADILSNEFAFDIEKATSSTLLLLCGSPTLLTEIDDVISCLKAAFKLTLTKNLDA